MSRVLSPQQIAEFDENGVLVVPQAVPSENLRAVIDAAFDFLGMDKNNPADWYRPPLSPGGMVEIYQHQALWNNRQNEHVYGAFVDLLGRNDLWVSIDRVNVKPPQNQDHPEFDHRGFMHWDTDVTRSWNGPLRVQGVLCLTDTTPDMGGFRCVPGHHKVVKAWGERTRPEPGPRSAGTPQTGVLTTPHAERDGRTGGTDGGSDARPDMSEVVPIALSANAGDLIIWNTLLFHGNGHNVSSKPRLAQYITMSPAPEPGTPAYDEARQKRLDAFASREPIAAPWVIGDNRHWERDHSPPAELTPLGRKLLGQDAWR